MGADRAVCSRCNRRAPVALILAFCASPAVAFAPSRLPAISRVQAHHCPTDGSDGSLAGEKQGRRAALRRLQVAGGAVMVGDLFGGLFGGSGPAAGASGIPGGATNEVVRVVNGIKHKRLGGSGIVVSEVGLGTQRWVSADFNAPEEKECFQMMDMAIRDGGVNLIDTAEQYPIPSDDRHPEGLAETTIGKWLAKDKSLRDKTVIATKITGGQRISGKSIISACENRRAPPPPTRGRTPRAPATAPQREPPPLHSPPRAQPAAPRHGLHRRVPVPLARALHPAVELGAGSLSEPCTAAPVTLNPAPHRLSS